MHGMPLFDKLYGYEYDLFTTCECSNKETHFLQGPTLDPNLDCTY